MKTLSEEFIATFGPDSGLRGCDFRPTFDGFLYNAYRVIDRYPTREQQSDAIWVCAKEVAKWLLAHRPNFSPLDRFQIIVGWPESVRLSARQIVKAGGGFDEIESLAATKELSEYETATGQVFFRPGWDIGVF